MTAFRIALNLLPMRPGKLGGGETYMQEMAIGLAGAMAEGEELILIGSDLARLETLSAKGSLCVEVRLRTKSPIERVLREQLVLPILLRKHRADVVILPANAPLLLASTLQLVAIHDLSSQYYRTHFPGTQSRLREFYVLRSVRLAARRAALILVPSDFSRREVIKHLGADPQKIVVTPYAGATSQEDLVLASSADASILARYGVTPQGYVLCVAFKGKHKNLDGLIAAWMDLRGRIPDSMSLVLLGLPGPGYSNLAQAAAPAVRTGSVVLVDDFVTRSDLNTFYRNASAFVLPSFYEGWGIPVLEAMANGVAVACSSAASLPEVVADAAILFDPFDTASIASAIERLVTDKACNLEMRQRGLKRASELSWTTTSELVLQAARKLVAEQLQSGGPVN